MAEEHWAGIDVSKAHLDVVVLLEAVAWRVANDAAGWAMLAERLATAAVAGIVLEATGSYHVGVVLALAAGRPPSVVNPAWIHAFRHSEGRRAKTDRADAHLLARYGQQKQPAPPAVLTAPHRALRALVGRREDLTKMLVMEKNRLAVAPPVIRASIEALITVLVAQQQRLDAEIVTVIAADVELARRDALVQSVPGIGPVLSAVLLAGLPELGVLGTKPIAALAGVGPHPQDSGPRSPRRSTRPS